METLKTAARWGKETVAQGGLEAHIYVVKCLVGCTQNFAQQKRTI